MVNININGKALQVAEGLNIVEAAKIAGIKIPTLCYHPDEIGRASCRERV